MNGMVCRPTAATLLAGLLTLATVAPPAAAQNPAPAAQESPYRISTAPDYSRGKSQFPNFIAPYTPIQVEEPRVSNTDRLAALIQNGQLRISLRDAIELALENNTDIAVQRYNYWLWDTDLLRTEGGGQLRGIGTTGTQNPFAGLAAISFDPFITSSATINSRKFPVNNPLTAGTGTTTAVNSLFTHTANWNIQYNQAFHSGTQISMGFNATRNTTTSQAVRFNPSVQTALTFSFLQPLLNGFGLAPVERFIRVARIGRRANDYAFQQSVITDITTVQRLYWELVYARNDVTVKQRSVELAQRLYDDNQRQVEIGTLAPIEVVRAEAQLASAQQQLIVAETYQLQQQNELLRVITRDPLDPALRGIEVVPTDMVTTPPAIEEIPFSEAIEEALRQRPDVLQAVTNLEAHTVNIRATRSAMLPSLNLSGFINSAGLSGNVIDRDPTSPTFGQAIAFGGLTDSASLAFRGRFPEYSATLSLNIPLRNRAAQADNARAQLLLRQDEAALQLLRNDVTVDVQNAQIALRQARAALLAAQKARELQEQTLQAEQTRFDLGASTVFLVVQAQRDLSDAASVEVRSMVNLVQAQVEFERALGRTLTANNISIADARSGQVTPQTRIPGAIAARQIPADAAPGRPGF